MGGFYMVIIVVDLGHFKAFRVISSELESTRIELIKDYDTIETHLKMSEKVSDRAGSFGSGSGKKTRKGYGEPHNIETEKKKRVIKQISVEIEKLLKKESPARWFLAADKSINKQIVENLSPKTNSMLDKSIIADLTKTAKNKLISRFGID
jgi:hypothetical protein